MPLSIDEKDAKILYELDLNCRQSLSRLAKKVKLPKTVVAYRIRRLESEGIIKNYYALIDASKLGYSSMRFYIKFMHLTPEKEAEIWDYFIKNKLAYWVGPKQGTNLDAVVIMWTKDQEQMYSFWHETKKKYSKYIHSYLVSPYIHLLHFHHDFLLGKERVSKPVFEITGGSKKAECSEKDIAILRAISANARASYAHISEKTGISPASIASRIRNLLKNGVIKAFRANIAFYRLGYLHYKFDLFISDYSKYDSIVQYMQSVPNLIYIDHALGSGDIECEFYFKSYNEAESLINDLKRKYSDSISTIDNSITSRFMKIEYMPQA